MVKETKAVKKVSDLVLIAILVGFVFINVVLMVIWDVLAWLALTLSWIGYFTIVDARFGLTNNLRKKLKK